MNRKTALQSYKRFGFSLAFLLTITATAVAQVGLDKTRVGKDLNSTLAQATAAMLVVDSFDITDTKEILEGRFQVDVSMTVKADKQRINDAIAHAKTNRLAANWREEVARLERLGQSALQKSGTTESIKAIYQINNFGAWKLIEISDNTSEYTRLRNEHGLNSAPEEAQVLNEFKSMVKLISNGAASINKFTIRGAKKQADNAVKLTIDMSLKGNNINASNLDFARGVNGITNTVVVNYQRDARGNWIRRDN